jgi:hypothetical protein
VQVSFNDHESLVEQWDRMFGNQPPDPARGPRPTGNNVFLKPVLSQVRDGRSLGSDTFGGPSPWLFQPKVGVWRKLELEVTPEVMRAWWGEKGQPIGELRQQRVEAEVLKTQESERRDHPGRDLAEGIDTRLVPRGGLGLFVSQAHASFRNVVITPLPPP